MCKIIFANFATFAKCPYMWKKSIWGICSGTELKVAMQDTWYVCSLNSNERHFLIGEKEENMHYFQKKAKKTKKQKKKGAAKTVLFVWLFITEVALNQCKCSILGFFFHYIYDLTGAVLNYFQLEIFILPVSICAERRSLCYDCLFCLMGKINHIPPS